MHRQVQIGSKIINLRNVEKLIDEVSKDMEIDNNYYGKVMVSAMEAVNNAIVHGNRADENKKVGIGINYNKKILRITVEDEGPGFNYHTIPDPTNPENIEKLNGRGVFLMKRLADDVEFNDKGNKVTLTFKIGAD